MQLLLVQISNVCSLIYDNSIVFLFRLIILYSNTNAHRDVWTSNSKRACPASGTLRSLEISCSSTKVVEFHQRNTCWDWCKDYQELSRKLVATGSVMDGWRSGRPSKASDPEVKRRVQEVFTLSPFKMLFQHSSYTVIRKVTFSCSLSNGL